MRQTFLSLNEHLHNTVIVCIVLNYSTKNSTAATLTRLSADIHC